MHSRENTARILWFAYADAGYDSREWDELPPAKREPWLRCADRVALLLASGCWEVEERWAARLAVLEARINNVREIVR